MKKEKSIFVVTVVTEIIAIFLSNIVLKNSTTVGYVILLAIEMFILIAGLIHINEYENQIELLLVPFFISPVIGWIFEVKILILILPLVTALVFLAHFIVWKMCIKKEKGERGSIKSADKSELYANKSVLVIVPHQDDDLNLIGGMIEEYRRYKSEIRICFYTNGDFETDAAVRLKESLNVASFYGIPEENIIFLGYGDRWQSESGHIFNAKDNRVVQSASGRKNTYALDEHKAYNDGVEYRRNNIVSDMKDVIAKFRPTDIFCVDYDCHEDHVACSLLFEEALVKVLKQSDGYCPNVYKGFAYETAFFSDNDFFNLNIFSTVNGRRTSYMKNRVNFNWNDRIRFPVSETATMRFMENNSLYNALKLYKSQNADDFAESVINGDKVFWLRRTDSILYRAEITATSGKAEVLNDFKIWDSESIDGFQMHTVRNIYIPDSDKYPNDGIWIPERDDNTKKITIHLCECSDIKTICLYDNPSRDDNIINAEIEFDNGEIIETGPLNYDGSATMIDVNQTAVSSFTVRITDWDGENPGLTEIEAFVQKDFNCPQYIKLTDKCDNFIYNYIVEKSDTAHLAVFSSSSNKFNYIECTISCDNGRCSTEKCEDSISVHCPKGETCLLTITSKDGKRDTVRITNPKNRRIITRAIRFDKYYYRIFRPHMQKKYYKNMLLYFYNNAVWAVRGFLTR